MFRYDNLTLSYQGKPVIKGLRFFIEPGEKVALIGPSGAGKSTLLKCLHQDSPVKTSFIHQDYYLTKQLSVFHNVFAGKLDERPWYVNLRNLVYPQAVHLESIEQLLDLLGLRDEILKKVGELSGGQQQRAAIARAIYRDSDLILGDEPLSALDKHKAEEITSVLYQSAQTVVLAIHSVHFALEFAKRIVGIKDGRIFFDLPSDSVTEDHLSSLYRP